MQYEEELAALSARLYKDIATVRGQLDKLTERQRDFALLRYIEGLSFSEISHTMFLCTRYLYTLDSEVCGKIF
jgi:DNA-directed RNA polymerase specialized sigma24 family protein